MTQDNEQNTSEEKAPVKEKPTGIKGILSNRRLLIRWILPIAVILILVVGVPKLMHTLSHISTDDAFIEGSVVPISPRVSGHIAKIHVDSNQWVKAGSLLVELDASVFKTRLDAAKAAVSAAQAMDRSRQAALELTEISATSGLDQAKEGLASVKAALMEAQSNLVLSRATLEQRVTEVESARAKHSLDLKDLKRYREMAQTQTITAQDLDRAETAEQISANALTTALKSIDTQKARVNQAKAAVAAAQANLRRAKAALDAAQSVPQQISQSRSQAEVARADVNRAKAQLEQAQLNLSYTKIYAPIDGYITKKGIEIGQFVQTGQSLMALVCSDLWVMANFKETQLDGMFPGQPVEIKVDAYPDLTLHGHIDSIQHGTGARFSLLPPENATGNYVKVVQRVPVKIIIDDLKDIGDVVLAPGMSVVPDVDMWADTKTDSNKKVAEKRPDPMTAN